MTYRELKAFAAMCQELTKDLPWRPSETVTSVPPTAAFIANRAIEGMMK